jgi:hypothetical protein
MAFCEMVGELMLDKRIKYTDEAKAEILKHICSQLSTGRPVSRILREDDGMPSSPTFYGWLFDDDEIASKVERAREFGAAALIDEIIDIADTPEEGEIITDDGEKVTRKTEDMLGHRKLRVYAREKAAAMIAPRRYGAKLDLTSGGEKLPANQVTQTKVDALIAVGVDKALKQRQLQLPPPEEKNNGED